MKRKRTQLTALALTVLLLVGTLAGCAGQNNSGEQSSGDEKIKISMYLWDRSMFKDYGDFCNFSGRWAQDDYRGI